MTLPAKAGISAPRTQPQHFAVVGVAFGVPAYGLPTEHSGQETCCQVRQLVTSIHDLALRYDPAIKINPRVPPLYRWTGRCIMATNKTFFLESLFRRHVRELRSCVRRRVGVQEAEDVVQETYLHLLKRSDPDSLREPRAYLFRSALNLSTDTWRNAQARQTTTDGDAEFERLIDPAPGPEALADGTLQLRRFLAALDELPEACRHALVLNKFEGRTHDKIAIQLGISTKTVRRHIARALAHCGARLGR